MIDSYTLNELQQMSIDRMSKMKAAILALSLYMAIHPYKKVIYRVIY